MNELVNPYATKTVSKDEFVAAMRAGGTAGSPNQIRSLPNGRYIGVITGWGVRNDGKARVPLTTVHPESGETKSVKVGVADDAIDLIAGKEIGESIGFSIQNAQGLQDDNGNTVRFGQINLAAQPATRTEPANTAP